MTTKTIMIDLFEGAEELDITGTWEVLAHWTQNHPDDGWRVELASDDGHPRRAAKGLVLSPTISRVDDFVPDIIVEPGGQGSRVRMRDSSYLEWLKRCQAQGSMMVSVCTGALVFAAAGILEGRPCITHHEALDELRAASAGADIRVGERWVDDGDVITAAGVSAGIDVALYLVGTLTNPARAYRVQKEIEYFPKPPE